MAIHSITILTEPNSTFSNLILLLAAYTTSSYTGNELYLVASFDAFIALLVQLCRLPT